MISMRTSGDFINDIAFCRAIYTRGIIMLKWSVYTIDNVFSYKCLFYIVNTMAADDMAPCVIKTLEAIVFMSLRINQNEMFKLVTHSHHLFYNLGETNR